MPSRCVSRTNAVRRAFAFGGQLERASERDTSRAQTTRSLEGSPSGLSTGRRGASPRRSFRAPPSRSWSPPQERTGTQCPNEAGERVGHSTRFIAHIADHSESSAGIRSRVGPHTRPPLESRPTRRALARTRGRCVHDPSRCLTGTGVTARRPSWGTAGVRLGATALNLGDPGVHAGTRSDRINPNAALNHSVDRTVAPRDLQPPVSGPAAVFIVHVLDVEPVRTPVRVGSEVRKGVEESFSYLERQREEFPTRLVREVEQVEVVRRAGVRHRDQRPLRFNSSCCRKTSRAETRGPRARRSSSARSSGVSAFS
jgi:hypothetical protein